MGIVENLKDFDVEPKSFSDFFYLIKGILDNWVDFGSNNRWSDVVSLWILGTYYHENFISFPYLFINAMKRSGKTKLLHLISKLARKGLTTTNLTEAVLFRMADSIKPTFCIDEIEGIDQKEMNVLRDLLNSAYKRGLFIMRAMRNKKTEDYDIKRYNVYCPIVMANITGIDDVLADRCIVVPLERSDISVVINKPEFFELDPSISLFSSSLVQLVQLVQLEISKDIYAPLQATLNSVITQDNDIYTTTETTLTTLNNNRTESTSPETKEFDNLETTLTQEDIMKMIENNIISRDLELWYPIFYMAKKVKTREGYPVLFQELFPFVKQVLKEKSESEQTENRDIVFLGFIYNNFNSVKEWIKIREIVDRYKEIDPDDKWFNSRWVGRALKRHRITLEKKRDAQGFEVIINWEKLNNIAKKLGLEKKIVKEEEKKDNILDYIEPKTF